jgi:hypothetical protein
LDALWIINQLAVISNNTVRAAEQEAIFVDTSEKLLLAPPRFNPEPSNSRFVDAESTIDLEEQQRKTTMEVLAQDHVQLAKAAGHFSDGIEMSSGEAGESGSQPLLAFDRVDDVFAELLSSDLQSYV